MNTIFSVKNTRTTPAAMLAYLLLPILMLSGEWVMAIEEPDYEVIGTDGDIEFRRYTPFVIAQTLVKEAQNRSESNNVGFRRLFKYISGNNTGQEKITMTAPVIQREGEFTESQSRKGGESEKGEKIAMTAPVQQVKSDDGWLVSFVLPLDYTLATAPVPDNPEVTLAKVETRTMAVLTFSGRWSEKNVDKHQKELMAKLAETNVDIIGEPEFAAYNAPFALPFLRRNEVMVEVSLSD